MKSPSLALCLIFGVCVHADAGDIVIRGVTIVDVTDGSLQPDRAVHVRGDRIAAVGTADTFSAPDEAEDP